MMLGTKIEAGATVDAYVMPQGLQVDSTKKIHLPQKPKDPAEVKVTKADGTDVTVNFTDKESDDLSGQGVNEGDTLFISGYVFEAPADNMKMAIASDKFAGSFKMVLDEQVFDADMQIIARKQTVFHKVIPNDSFTLDGNKVVC